MQYKTLYEFLPVNLVLIQLIFAEGDARFITKLQDYTAVEKEEVTLNCELSKDVPVKWFHNEIEIKASKLVSLKVEGKRRTLCIKKVEQKDKGVYSCDCGTDKTSAKVNIEGDLLKYSQVGNLALFIFTTSKYRLSLSQLVM